MGARGAAIICLLLAGLAQPALAQITVLDSAQDGRRPEQQVDPVASQPGAPPPPCGSQAFTLAGMSWPSAAVLAEIHARILTAEFGCQVQVVPGDPAATISAMGSTGQPAAVPELWVNRIADVWNGAMEAQMLRSAAPTYQEGTFEGWYMPSSMAAGLAAPPSAAELAQILPQIQPEAKVRFISCPLDWACSVINHNLVAAHGLSDRLDIVDPANRLEMDRLIAEAYNRREPFLFYYWQPNAVLAQLDFTPLDMGAYDETAARCLAGRACADPQPSAFAPDLVVIALAERVFTDMPAIAGYFQRASLPLAEMDALLAQLNAGEASPASVAERFVAERRDLWSAWIGNAAQ